MSARPAAQLAPTVDGRPVLVSAPLRPGFDRAALSRYGDQIWDLSPAVFRENARRCHVTVRFDSVADPMIATALREYLYARLNVERPGYRPVLPPASVRGAFNRARRFFEFVTATLGRCELGRVDQALTDRYVKTLRSAGVRPVVVSHLLEVVFDLHALRDQLPTARLSFEPWPGRSPSHVAGVAYQAAENRTPRIPEPIIAPLLAWSLCYIEVFAPDILAARAELTALEAKRDALRQVDVGLSWSQVRRQRRERLAAYFEQRRVERRGVPIWTTAHNGVWRRDVATGALTPPINAYLLHLHMGVDAQSEPADHLRLKGGAADLIAAAVAELGLEVGGMDTAISELPGAGRPWRPRFDAKTLAQEERMLQAACYVACAYLTGMRDCEVQAMRFGCVSVARSEDGMILRHRLQATAYKGKRARGEPAEWVTIAPVAQAVQVLEQLSARSAGARGVDTLWPVLSLKTGTKTHVSAEIVRQLNAFRDHLNGLFGAAGEPVIPPAADGSPWRFTTRQFRRTIAWHIANRPFGTVAGMIQYKHASVAAFEGYAGSSRSGFRAEVEAERRLGQLDDILDYFEGHQVGARLSGPAAVKVGRALDAAAEGLGPSPTMIADRGRLRVLLASTARSLHPGLLADCFFDPSTALCLAGRAPAASPVMPLCQPTRCPNACITARHRPAWARSADDVRELLREKRLSSAQRTVLAGELARFQTVLDDLDQVSPMDGASAAQS
ncbi:integrase [Phenylobacterium sp. VNQ135]|uniref:integrase n=1 Tax=Phenylobacterium sp. VNQ135 TaxID=3400922 RepID=UPI003C0FE52F